MKDINNTGKQWELLVVKLSAQFNEGEPIDLDGIIYLVGVQELGQLDVKFKKDDKINLMHLAICRLLEPYGYYEFTYFDEDHWPHFELKKQLPTLKAGEQTILMKQAIIEYFYTAAYIQD